MVTSKRGLFASLIICLAIVILAVGMSGRSANAQAPGPEQQASSQAPTIPYNGRLTNTDGQVVVDGSYDFTFNLYDALEGGNLLWSESQAGVPVKAGSFKIDLGKAAPLPDGVLSRKEAWLSISLRGPGESAFTVLTPRQMISTDQPAAVNALTCPHSHFSDSWSGAITSYGLLVNNTSSGDGLRAFSYTTASNYAGLYAYNLAASGAGRGVYAGSYYGTGVFSTSQYNDGMEVTTDAPLANGKSAVYAHATNANGVWAVSTNRIGVYGDTSSTAGNVYGVQGYNGGAPTGSYGGYFTSKNYRGAYLATLNYSWYGAAIDGGLYVTNGSCTGCTMAYVGLNEGPEAIRPGDLVAVSSVKVDAASGQPVMQLMLAKTAGDVVIGVAIEGTSAPGSQGAPDKVPGKAVQPGEYLLIATSGLVQARVADANAKVGAYMQPASTGAVVVAEQGSSIVRLMSQPDASGLAWVMVNGH